MSKHKELKDYREQIEKCVKCGACQAHCPVFSEQKTEATVARGKVALAHALLNGDVDIDERFAEAMSKCVLCNSCGDKCPNLVPTEEIIMAARREVVRQRGLTSLAKGVSLATKNPALMKLATKGGSAFSKLLFKRVPDGSGLRLRFPAPYITGDRTLPELPSRHFRDSAPAFVAGETEQETVSFFTGCSINYVYPQIGDDLLKILRFMGISVRIPKDQGCCGLPALAGGDGPTVEELAARNLKAFDGHADEPILTACASCNAGIGKHYEGLGDDYAAFAARVKDILVFLVERGLVEKLAALPKKEQRQKVTYHAPCHLRTAGIHQEPRALLSALPSVEFVEMDGADRCCGMGGTFSVYHYETSKQIGAHKVPGLKKSGAELVATACPGCMMQLQDIINHAEMQQQSVHILSLIARDLPA